MPWQEYVNSKLQTFMQRSRELNHVDADAKNWELKRVNADVDRKLHSTKVTEKHIDTLGRG